MQLTHQAVSVGEKVKIRGHYGRYTVKFLQGAQAYCASDTGNQVIASVDDLTPFILKASNGWFLVAGKTGYAYDIEWEPTTGRPVYRWGFNFATQKMEAFPQPFGAGAVPDVFDHTDFTPVKLTTQKR